MALEKDRDSWLTRVKEYTKKVSYDANYGREKSFHDLRHPPKARNIYDLLTREYDYPTWFSLWHMLEKFMYLTEGTFWNSLICILTATGIVLVATELDRYNICFQLADLTYNIVYLINVVSFAYLSVHVWNLGPSFVLGVVIDLGTYLHYISRMIPGTMEWFKLFCYYLRLHRPLQFLRALDNYNLQSSVAGTALKYMYIFCVVRITWGLVWMPLLPPDLYTVNTTTIATQPTEWLNITTTFPTTAIEKLNTSSSEESDDSNGPSSSDDDSPKKSDKTAKKLRRINASKVLEKAYIETENPIVRLPIFQGHATHKTKTPEKPLIRVRLNKTDETSTTIVTTSKGIKLPSNVTSEAPEKRTKTLKKSRTPIETTSRSTNKTARSPEKSSSPPVRARETLKENSKTDSETNIPSNLSDGDDEKYSSYAVPTEKIPSSRAGSSTFHFPTKPAWNRSTKAESGNITLSWNTRWISATRKSTTRIGPVRKKRFRRHLIYKLMQKSSSDDPFYAAKKFFAAFYITNKMFIPVGPPVPISTDLERLVCLCVMISGCLIVSGAATASLSLTISMYLRPEESFRTRYRLIMQEMIETNVPEDLRDKVDTFYKMYWHKQKDVSTSKLLPTFPPCLHTAVIMDIYFEAMQKSRVLQDLSSTFLSEVAKCMQTIHFIPGDAIIKRSSKKSSMIYLTYGDVEMLTAEDDSTPMLRMTRGTILSSCGACASVACARAHVMIRAATFCVAHVLHAPDLWYMAWRRGRRTGQGDIMQNAFLEHFEKVKTFHLYDRKLPVEPKYKSSILLFKQNLVALKQARDPSGHQLLGQTDVFLEIAGCYIMRNREDIALSDDADAICLRPTFPCILQPSSSLLAAWTWFMAFVIFIVCIVIPFQLVFNQEVSEEYRFYNYVITALFVLDIIIHLSTGANVEEGVPITFTQTSSQQMRSIWFLMDVLATVPIFEFIGDGHFASINKVLRIMKAFRTFTGMEEVLAYESKFLRMMSYMIALILVTFFVATMQQGFMCYQFDYCVVENVTNPPYWSQRPLNNATEESLDDTLVFSLYWAANIITFTTHIDTLGMLNWANAVYTVFILEVCIYLHMFIEALYSATIMVTSSLLEQYESMIDDVKNVFMKSDVEPLLQERFITYLQLCWYTDKAYSMTHKRKTIFFDLPPHVHQNIMSRQRSKYIMSIPFMKFFSKEDLKNISSNCMMFYTSPNEILLCTGDISSEMYVLKKGICEMLNPDTQECDKILKSRDHFGVLDCLLRFPAFYTVRAITHVQVISLPRKYLLDAILSTPQLRKTIEFAKQQPEYRSLLARRERFISYEPLPPTPHREFFRLPRKHEPDSEYMEPFKHLGAMSVLRYICPRFTIRPDGQYLIRYEIFHALTAFTTAMLVPGYTYLILDWPQLYYVLWFVDFAAYFDILQRMIVGYFDDKGVLIYHPASTAAYYLKGAFLVDVIAALPLENLVEPKRERYRQMFHVTLTQQCWMLNRLVQLYRLPSAMMVLEKYVERKDILLILKMLPLFLTMLNVLTCLMVFRSSRIFYNNNTYSITTLGAEGGPWFNMLDKNFRFNATLTPTRLHLACYFWVVYVSTTTGYNTITPYESKQMITLIIGMILGALIMTYVSVRIISIRSNVNTLLAEYQENMKDIIIYMQSEHLDKNLKKEVLNYYSHNWEKLGGVDYRHVLKMCHQINLRTDAVLHLYGSTFANCHLLADSDMALVRILGRSVRSVYFLKNTHLYNVDDVMRNIYIVEYGSVRMHINGTEKLLIRGSIYGNLQGPNTILCPVDFEGASDIHLLQINAKAFHNIIFDFPNIRQKLLRLCPERECYIEGIIAQGETSNVKVKPKVMRQVVSFFHYNYPIIQIYLILISLACIFTDTYNMGFQVNTGTMIFILYVFDAAFLCKVLFLMAIPTVAGPDSSLRKLLEGSRSSYYKSELKCDILSCVPLEALCYLWPRGKERMMWFSLLRLNRVFRVVTVYKRLMQYHEQLYINLTLTTVASTLIWFTLYMHVNSCLWYFIGMRQEGIQPKSSWIYDDDGNSKCDNKYICSLYFVFTTFSQNGVGDIMPKQINEVVFACVLMLTSTSLSMVYVGEFSNIIQYKSFRSFGFYCKYLELQEFLKNNRVSHNLVKLVNRYALHLWRETRGEQLPYFLKKAPYCLKLRIMSAAYMQHLVVNEMFIGCEAAFLRQLVCYLRLYCYNEGMYVVKEGDITECMYIIHKGRVVECSEETGDTGKFYNTSDQFGMLQGLQYDYPFLCSYRCIWKSQVLSLRLKDWEQLMQHFPKSRDAIYRNLRRHHPRQRPDYNTDNSHGDAGDRPARFAPARKAEETQTGDEFQKEHKHDQRKHLFDRNLFEDYESSLTSIRHKSVPNELGDALNAAPVQGDSDEMVVEQPKRKGIIKYDSEATSSRETDSEAMVEKMEKHIATVEFEDHLSDDVKKQKEEQDERLVTTIDIEGKKGVEISHPMITYESKAEISKLVTSSTRLLSKSPSNKLEEVKLKELNYNEKDQKKRDTKLETIVDMDQDEDGAPLIALKRTVSHFKNRRETDKRDDDELEKEDKEKEITAVNIDQKRHIMRFGQPAMDYTKSTDDIHLEEKSVEKLVTTINLDEDNVMPPKREERIQHRLRISSEDNLELSQTTDKKDIKNVMDQNTVYDGNEKDEQEVISVNINDSEEPRVTQKDKPDKVIPSNMDGSILTSLSSDIRRSNIEDEKENEIDKDATVAAKKCVTTRRVKYLEKDDIDKTRDEDDKLVRTNQSSPTVSFKEDTISKKSADT